MTMPATGMIPPGSPKTMSETIDPRGPKAK